MAINPNIQFSDKIGPVVGCLRYEKYCYRSLLTKVGQTKATKPSSNNFGLASKAGKILRLYLAASIPRTKDLHMHKRLANNINKWLGLSVTGSAGSQSPANRAGEYFNHCNTIALWCAGSGEINYRKFAGRSVPGIAGAVYL